MGGRFSVLESFGVAVFGFNGQAKDVGGLPVRGHDYSSSKRCTPCEKSQQDLKEKEVSGCLVFLCLDGFRFVHCHFLSNQEARKYDR